MAEGTKENWGSGGPYEQYVGRWSRKVAREFLVWLRVASRLKWGDVGCGTGALAHTILADADPQSIAAIDRADGYIAEARRRITDSRVRFEIGGRGPLIPGDPESEPEAIRSRQGIP